MSAASFDAALARVLAHEGGYVNHPADPGGPTKFGVTLAVYRQAVKPDATAADVRAMPRAHAAAIYRQRYWNALSCDALPAGLDYAAFDYGVNSGVGRAARVLRALVGLEGAGGIDAETLARIRARDPRALVGALCDERLAFLKRLKTWSVFGTGWARRVAAVRADALALAAGAVPAPAPANADGASAKGVAPADRKGPGSAGAVVAGGAVAAERAHAAGLSAWIIAAIALAALALALALWWLLRARRRRLQQRPALAAAVPPLPTSSHMDSHTELST
jgi:lysozyme family protein